MQRFPCFLLHGGPGFDSSLFRSSLDPLWQALSPSFINYCDRPPGHVFTMEGLVADLDRLRNEGGHDQFFLLGHSAGGFFALEYAIRFPQHVAGLILVSTAADTAFVKEAEENLKRFPLALQGLKDYLASKRTDEDYREMSLKYLECSIVPAMRAKASELFRRMKYSAACFEQLKRNYLPRYSVKAALRSLTMPVLVIAGERDLVIPPRYSKELAQFLPNAEYAVIPDCNHFPFIERTEEFCEVVGAWVRKRAKKI